MASTHSKEKESTSPRSASTAAAARSSKHTSASTATAASSTVAPRPTKSSSSASSSNAIQRSKSDASNSIQPSSARFSNHAAKQPHHSAASKMKPPARSSSSSSTATPHTTRSIAAPSASIVHRTLQIGRITLSIVQTDIVAAEVDTVINAANSLSFTPMDNGISGVLRRACAPAVVTGVKKRWWDENDIEHQDLQLPRDQAGYQPAAGQLLERGVKHIIHANGPIWTDYKVAEATFGIVTRRIRLCVHRALSAAARVGSSSCALPAISGGIFTHWKEGSDIQEREQRAARRAVLEAAIAWAEEQEKKKSAHKAVEYEDISETSDSHAACSSIADSDTNTLTKIMLCDLSRREKGAIHLFVDQFDAWKASRDRNAAAPEGKSEE